MATYALIALCVSSHALRPAARTTRRAAPRMLLDVASAGHVIAAATPSLDYATHLAAAPSVDATHLIAAAAALDYKALATKAIGGGASGALAGVVQVSSLMWLRTAMNYQYANGGNGTLSTVATLYEEGGLPRLYRGVQYALVQNPLSRFGDAAANAAVPALVVSLVPGCVEIKILRRPPRYRRDACSMLWRYRFPTARRNQDGRVIAMT